MSGINKKFLKGFDVLSPTRMIVFSFTLIILFGTVLLLLPCSVQGKNLSLIDALFTSVSATCVTGLTVMNIGSELTSLEIAGMYAYEQSEYGVD